MEPEVQARATLPVVVVNREGLYVIIAVLGASILGCACVLAYSLGNYGKLKKNAEEVRNYIAHRGTKAAVDEPGGGKQAAAAGNAGSGDARSVPAKTPVSIVSTNRLGVGAGPSLGAGRNTSAFASVVRRVSDTFVVAAKQEETGAAASEAQHFQPTSSGGGSCTNDSSSAGEAATTHESASTVATDVRWNRTGRYSTEAA